VSRHEHRKCLDFQGDFRASKRLCTPLDNSWADSLSAIRNRNRLIHLYNYQYCCYHPNEYPNVVFGRVRPTLIESFGDNADLRRRSENGAESVCDQLCSLDRGTGKRLSRAVARVLARTSEGVTPKCRRNAWLKVERSPKPAANASAPIVSRYYGCRLAYDARGRDAALARISIISSLRSRTACECSAPSPRFYSINAIRARPKHARPTTSRPRRSRPSCWGDSGNNRRSCLPS
jgi:hypothetical protein